MPSFGTAKDAPDARGRWLSISHPGTVPVRLFVPHQNAEERRNFTLSWPGGIDSPRTIYDFTRQLFEQNGNSLVCTCELWVDDAPPPKKFYFENIREIKGYLDRWGGSLASFLFQDLETYKQKAYVWTKLDLGNSSENPRVDKSGEVGLQMDENGLSSGEFRGAAISLFRETFDPTPTEDEVQDLFNQIDSKLKINYVAVSRESLA